MTAEMAAEALPLPPEVVDGEPVGAGTPEEETRRRRKKAVVLLLLGLLAMLVTIVIWYLIFRQPISPPIPLIPETQVPSYSTSIYGATNPFGIAVSPDGSRIYVSQTEGTRVVQIFDAGGNPVGTMAPPETTGTDHVPVFVAIDPLTAEVYVTDRPMGSIYIYDRDGAYQRTLALVKPIAGWQPVGVAFDAAGSLYVSDLSGPTATVEVFDRGANLVRTMGEDNRLSFPNGVAVDKDGNVYVADGNNGRLLVFDPAGQLKAQVGRGTGQGNLGLPRGVAIDSQGRVFVGDATGQGVFAYRTLQNDKRTLDSVGFFGGQGAADGRFSFPNGVAVDARGRVYVADSADDRVQVWSY